jgi:hypothetical protein
VTADAASRFKTEHPAIRLSWGMRPDRRIPLSPGTKEK